MSKTLQVLDPTTKNPVLEIMFVGTFNKVWADHGSGADKNLTVWRPEVPPGFHRLGHFASPGYNSPAYPMIAIRNMGGDAVARPTDYEQFWADNGSGADMDGSFWRPIPPNNYVALGSVVQNGYDKPSLDEVVCIRRDLVTRGKVGEIVWGDWGSGADRSCSLYDLVANAPQTDKKTTYISSGSFCGHHSYDKMLTSDLAYCLAVELPMVTHTVDIEVPALTSTERPEDESAKYLTAVTYLPCTLVKDPAYNGDLIKQIANDSFYSLERYTSYRCLQFAINDNSGDKDSFSYTITKGISKTDSETIKNSTSIAISAGYGGGSLPGPNFQVTLTYAFAISNTTSTTISKSESTTYEATVPVNGATGIFTTVDTFVLKRSSDGATVSSWEIPRDTIQKLSYDPAA